MELACPNCHLEVPRAMLAQKTHFFSIFGVPGSGKTFFLTAMTKQLERTLSHEFGLRFGMLASRFNDRLEKYQNALFKPEEPNKVMYLPKTQKAGDLYSRVTLNEGDVDFPIPMLFDLKPTAEHPDYHSPQPPEGVFVLYDNSGEDFAARNDLATRPVTNHLLEADVIFVVIDPLQYATFSDATPPSLTAHNQEQRLTEVLSQKRAQLGQSERKRESKPICVVVTKFDSWRDLIRDLESPWTMESPGTTSTLRTAYIEDVSHEVRTLLKKRAGTIVETLEAFTEADNIRYFPVSSTGCPTEPIIAPDGSDDGRGVRPANIKPFWTEVPMLYAMQRWMGLPIPGDPIRCADRHDNTD